MSSLVELGMNFYRDRQERKAKAAHEKKQAAKRKPKQLSGADEQRALERAAMLQQQAACRAMALEDARSMAIEMKERTYKVLTDGHKNETKVRKWEMQQERQESSFLKEEGFLLRFERDPKYERFRESPEMFETFNVGVGVRSFTLIDAQGDAFMPLKRDDGLSIVKAKGGEIIQWHHDSVLASCSDGTVRLCIYQYKHNRTSSGKMFVCGRHPGASPVHCSVLVPPKYSPTKGSHVVLFGCGDGSIRSGWSTWHKLYRRPEFEILKDEEPVHQSAEESIKQAEYEAGCHHDDVVYGMTRHDSFLYSWSGDGTIKKWSLETGHLLNTYKDHSLTAGGISSCVISKDGKYILSAGDATDPVIRLWDASHKNDYEQQQDNSISWYDRYCCDCDHNRRMKHARNKLIRTKEYQTKLLVQRQEEKDGGELLQVEDFRDQFSKTHHGMIRVFHNHGKGQASHGDWINQVCLCPDNELAASCSSDRWAKVWSFPDGEFVSRFECEDWVMSCAIGRISDHNDKVIKTLITCCANSMINIWNIETKTLIQTLHGHNDSVLAGAFLLCNDRFKEEDQPSQVRNYIRTCALDGTIRSWKLGSGKPFAPPPPIITDTTKETQTIRWEMPVQNGATVTEFVIERRENEIGAFRPVEGGHYVVDPKQKAFSFKRRIGDLHPGSLYEFRVAAISKHGQGPFSLPSEARRCSPDVPGRVDAPIVNFMDVDGADLTWVAPDSMGAHITQFVIRCRGGTSTRNFEESPEVIVPWKDAKAKAERDIERIDAHQAKMESWLETNRHLGLKEMMKVKRQMKQEESVARKRQVLHGVATSPKGSVGIRNAQFPEGEMRMIEMSWFVKGLEAGMSYQFSIAAENKVGRGEFSPPSTSELTKTSAPTKMETCPQLSGVTTSSISISWDPIRDNGAKLSCYTVRAAAAEVMDRYVELAATEEASIQEAEKIYQQGETIEMLHSIESLSLRLNSKDIVQYKEETELTRMDFKIMQMCVYLINPSRVAVSMDPENPVSDEAASFKLPNKLEVDAFLRHPDQFIDRIAKYRVQVYDLNHQSALRPCIMPLPSKVHEMIQTLPAKELLKLPVCRALLEWMKSLLTFDVQVYQNKVFPHLKNATMVWHKLLQISTNEMTIFNVNPAEHTLTIPDLRPGKAYRFQVRAQNAHGPGPFSDPSKPLFVKRGPPSCPRGVVAHDPTPCTMQLSWEEPEFLNGSTLLGYHIFWRVDRTGTFHKVTSVGPDRRAYTFKNLQVFTFYEFYVIAENDMGESEPSEVSPTCATLAPQPPNPIPEKPKVFNIEPKQINISFPGPGFDGGDAIFAYHVLSQDQDDKIVASVYDPPPLKGRYEAKVTDIEPGQTYRFAIVAENDAGKSHPSPSSEIIAIPTEAEFYLQKH